MQLKYNRESHVNLGVTVALQTGFLDPAQMPISKSDSAEVFLMHYQVKHVIG
jgi:hypothetical protein